MAAVLYWGPSQGPDFRELPRWALGCKGNSLDSGSLVVLCLKSERSSGQSFVWSD